MIITTRQAHRQPPIDASKKTVPSAGNRGLIYEAMFTGSVFTGAVLPVVVRFEKASEPNAR
jgi:hypothetical protein